MIDVSERVVRDVTFGVSVNMRNLYYHYDSSARLGSGRTIIDRAESPQWERWSSGGRRIFFCFFLVTWDGRVLSQKKE